MTSLYSRILEQTERLGITGKQLGALLGLKKSPLTDWKNQKSSPTLEQFKKMCEIFAISPTYLLYGSDKYSIPTNAEWETDPSDHESNPPFSNVGLRIAQRIKELGLKQSDICDKIGLSTTALSQYCSGARIPDTASLYKIANALSVSMEWILTGKDIETENCNMPSDLAAIKRTQCLTADNISLVEEEVDLIAMFRLLPPSHREEIFDLIYFKYKRAVEKKRESIYSTYLEDDCDKKDDKNASSIA